ncbi:MAG: TonB-dependent receptor [Flavobacteriales bacterium]
MKSLLTTLAALCCSFAALSQVKISGTVTDSYSGETLPGATIFYADGKGAISDMDGHYELNLPEGKYTLTAKFVGFQELKKEIVVNRSNMVVDFPMISEDLKEIEIIADIAVDRKTPVAFSDVGAMKIKEELGTQDLPMLLNTTPGVYATQSGGGDGDARINIRGFNQRNVAVMVDGIPMNDMENGWVYWSNWFGLDNVTQKMQVQRGLGASKLAIPAIGGNINILTQGIDQKQNITIGTEYGNNNNMRQSIGYNSGRLKGNWGVTGAFAYKQNDGWVTNLNSRQFFYFLKVQKEIGKHSFSISTMGSPQEHAQRINRQPMYVYDADYARSQGVEVPTDPAAVVDQGLRYNSEWGYITRNRYDENAPTEVLNTRQNYYYKPIANFKHFWAPNRRFALSNILYASWGKGGGTRLNSSLIDPATGQQDLEYMYKKNTKTFPLGLFGISRPYNVNYVNDTTQYLASYYMQSSINNHQWYGLLSTFKYNINEQFDISGGLDARYYKTERYQEVYDLLGADYVYITSPTGFDANDSVRVKRLGDRINYNINSYVKQGGLFFLGEYNYKNWAAFVNVTGSINQYNRVNLFALKDENGNYQESGWKTFPGATIKGGFNYKVNGRNSIYVNTGYLSRAQMIANVYNGTTLQRYQGIENEKVAATELGHVFKTDKFRSAINLYYTNWKNRPVTVSISQGTENYYAFVPGMEAVHAGGELELEYQMSKKLQAEGVVSIGNWTWQSQATAYIYNEIGTDLLDSLTFDTKGVRVGDAAQTQLSLGVRYSPFKGFYIKPRITYFDHNYADFNPEDLVGDNGARQSWKMPAYYTLDLAAGYTRPLAGKYKIGVRLNLINITNQIYISDATNGQTFDAQSATVYFGQGFRWNVGVNFNF